MIIFRTASDQLGAIHIAQAFDKHELCVVSMVPHITLVEAKEAMRGMENLPVMEQKQVWLVVGQGASVDIEALNADIEGIEHGPLVRSYVEEVPDRSIKEADDVQGPN